MEVTLLLAILLGAGFVAAKAGQFVRLPSVTGYICAGLLLGPSGFHVLTVETIADKLAHFTQIALMLIAFGIGEHLELKRLRYMIKSVACIGVGEICGTFLCVAAGVFWVSSLSNLGIGQWQRIDFLMLAMFLGAVAVATAPATLMHILRELRATGPLTANLLPVVAVNNGVAIMMFGVTLSVARHLGGKGAPMMLAAIGASLTEIFLSLFLGVLTGLLIDIIVHRLHHRGEMLTAGLALLLLCGEGARQVGLSPLLAGMAAGFTIVNRDHRDVRLFRALNDVEAPMYVLFFTLAGAHLELSRLALAGWLGLLYFFLRGLGKVAGASLGAWLAGASPAVRGYTGLTLIPQAGVAIGLVLLIGGDVGLDMYAAVITPVVLAAVVLAELIGPVSVRFALVKAGEAMVDEKKGEFFGQVDREPFVGLGTVQLMPWTWKRLQPHERQAGVVIFGAAHAATVAGVARMATIMAHHHGGRPLAVRIFPPDLAESSMALLGGTKVLFAAERSEVNSLGYELDTAVVEAQDVASGIISVARQRQPWAIVLGYSGQLQSPESQRVVEGVLAMAPCQVVVVRLASVLHTERILVPVLSTRELEIIGSVTCALAEVGRHRVTILRLLPPDTTGEEAAQVEDRVRAWVRKEKLPSLVQCRSQVTDAPLETIVHEAEQHDLLVMAAGRGHGLQRLFFGSLTEEVVKRTKRTVLMVHAAD